jgi:acyl-CoA reductase-like NAD-dependent aldehyde dehydrogenase
MVDDNRPSVVGETGGKNFHFVHQSADLDNVTFQTIRAAFEYQGQKCSACSRIYIPDNLWPDIKSRLLKAHSRIKVGPVDGKQAGSLRRRYHFIWIKSHGIPYRFQSFHVLCD